MKIFIKILKYPCLLILGFLMLTTVEVFTLRWLPIPRTILMVMRNKEFKEDKAYQFKQKWVSLSDISPYVVKAVIASEDNLFYQHKGFDWKEINIAMEQNKQGKRLRGASTISQQVAKNVFLWPDRSWLRKGLEAYYTVLIELLWNKERIMEVYLNVAEMGKGIFGIEAAAQAYFKKPASKLSAKEAALVAAALPSPLKRNPAKPGSYMQTRQRQILNLIDKLGHLTESNSAQ
ncbi:MAG: monofunctional biosynthetic peptidoglycan transglycosylase [Prevotellaceae bacterium]|nr:monofunctional biosynthetic peptidoglycan transglycosylase [Prevotellaceae bacterium]